MHFKWRNIAVSVIGFLFKTQILKQNSRTRNHNNAHKELIELQVLSPVNFQDTSRLFLKMDDDSKFWFWLVLIRYESISLNPTIRKEYSLKILEKRCDVFHKKKHAVEACFFLENPDVLHIMKIRSKGSFGKIAILKKSIEVKYCKCRIRFSQSGIVSSFQIPCLEKRHLLINTGKG